MVKKQSLIISFAKNRTSQKTSYLFGLGTVDLSYFNITKQNTPYFEEIQSERDKIFRKLSSMYYH